MTAYYNEFDPKAAAWLRELIKEGHIAPGEVDERSIEDVAPSDLTEFAQCHFFAGIGVWSYALRQAEWSDDKPIWTGSCPCQPFSTAGKGAGFTDERHLWPSFRWLIQQCLPDVVFGEQVAGKAGETWFDIVSTDLEDEGYSVGAAVAPACGFGAPHQRKRLYWVANSPSERRAGKRLLLRSKSPRGPRAEEVLEASRGGTTSGFWGDPEWLHCRDGKLRPVEPGTFPLADGAPSRVGLLRGYGNALVAPQAQSFIEAYMETIQ